MPELVPMPKLGFDMTAGTLVRIAKRDGEMVAKGDVIADIETDKTTIEVEAYLGGLVAGWLVAEGEQVPVGTPMVVIAAPGETVDMGKIRAEHGATPVADSRSEAKGTPKPSAASPAVSSAPAGTPVPPADTPSGRVIASPIARRMAEDAGIDLRRVAGTGPNGRITKKDIENFLKAAPAPAAATPVAPSAPVVAAREDETIPLTKLRQIIARRMTESTTTIPQFYVTSEIDMGAAMDLRKQINALLPDERKASVNDLIVKAVALALRQFPNLNASFAGDKLIRKGHVNVGIAVSVPGGLLTVVVRDTDQMPLAQIAAQVKVMVARARDGKVQPADIEGSTFSVSNLGMYDAENFIAIINPPEAAILAVGAVREVPVVKNGALVSGVRLKATCSADHRVTDGAEVAQFMQAFKKNLEEPLRLLV